MTYAKHVLIGSSRRDAVIILEGDVGLLRKRKKHEVSLDVTPSRSMPPRIWSQYDLDL